MSLDDFPMFIFVSSFTGFIIGLCAFKVFKGRIDIWYLTSAFIIGSITSFLTTFFYPLVSPLLLLFKNVSFQEWAYDIVPFYSIKDINSVIFFGMLCFFYCLFGGISSLVTFVFVKLLRLIFFGKRF